MGKKQVAQQNTEEAIKESEAVAANIQKIKTRERDRVPEVRVYISSSYNNSIITLTDGQGRVLASKSAGAVGFKGTKKSTSFAASRVAEAIALLVKKVAAEKVYVFVKGIGAGRESAVRTLVAQGLNVVSIKDITPIPHNGPKPKKVRRV